MIEFLKSISNREYATIFLVLSFFLYFFIKSADVRKSILQVLQCIFFSKFWTIFIFPIIYLTLITYLLYEIGFWDFSLLKDTIISYIYALLVVSKSISTENFKLMYKEYLLGYISFSCFLEFVIGTYDFNFFIEVVLIAFVSLLGMTSIYMEYQKDTPQSAKDFLNNILSFIGFLIVLHCIKSFCSAPAKILCIHSLQILILPIIYAVMLIPVCYFVWIYCKYEGLLSRLFVLRKDLQQNSSRFQITFKIICLCGTNIERLNLWWDFLLLNRSNNKNSNLDDLINEFKQRYKYIEPESNTDEVKLNVALNYMKDFGFLPAKYKYIGCSEGYGNYQALSYNKDDMNKYYCINGNQQYPQLFILYDFILPAKEFNAELDVFLIYCEALYFKIFSKTITKKVVNKIKNLKDFNLSEKIYNIQFKVDKNMNDKITTLTFKISKISPNEFCEQELSYQNVK